MIRKVSLFLAAALFASTFGSAGAQQVSLLDRQLSRMDFGISGAGLFNKNVSGPVISTALYNCGTATDRQACPLTLSPSNTIGGVFTIRYIVKPLVGFEFNYGYARYTENFASQPVTFGAQTRASEYTLGYIYTPAYKFFGFQPFVSGGAGATEFKPTPHGGEGLPEQARATYYYSAGLQQEYFSSHFGFRASFRQLFFLAPDFGQNYLTILKHTTSTEPTIGFYLRY
ncbi:hypothetical protein [Granulicella sp. S156]|uniref:hypothetical protein n=1 Tax=Granulicella sp. S156 TaxID=1747224 RepID=UPI00131E5DC2|nr:hypothetical protein [Granulicella sp. S156]